MDYFSFTCPLCAASTYGGIPITNRYAFWVRATARQHLRTCDILRIRRNAGESVNLVDLVRQGLTLTSDMVRVTTTRYTRYDPVVGSDLADTL